MASENAHARYIAEFLGTFMLVFTIGCNVLVGNKVWGVTSIACVLTVMVYALGPVSGAHLNPAVTCAIAFCGKIEWREAAIYMALQMLGGLIAGYSYMLIFGNNFNLSPAPGYTFVGAGNIEFLYTYLLCFVVLCSACTSKKFPQGNQFFGLAIGFVIVAGGYAGGWISGGCFNPAVAFGIDASSADKGFGWCLVYMGFEICAALFAAVTFRVVHPEEFDAPTLGDGLFANLLCEFIGTFFLVLTVGLNVIGGSAAAAWSIAASLMVCIYACGPVSGAHLNPAVTFSILCSGREKTDVKLALCYMGTQIGAGVMAGITYSSLTGSAFALAPGAKYGYMHAAFAETAFTFLLCFVVLSVATIKDPLPDFFGLAIASCVVAGGYAIGSISGGSLNPAVSWGLDAANAMKGGRFACSVFYTLFELIGGALAAAAFMATHQDEYIIPEARMEEKNP